MSKVKTADITYGSDKNGLVWAYLFAAGSAPRELDSEGAAQWVAEPAHPGSEAFVWLHFSLSNASCERWMRQALPLPEAFYEAMKETVGSTRLEQAGDALVAVIHDVLFKSDFDSSNVSTAALCIMPRMVVSARLRPLRSVDRLRSEVRSGQTFHSAAGFLAQLMRDQAEVLIDIVRQSTVRVDAVEDTILASRFSVSRSELSGLRRSLVRMQRLLAPEPAALFRLLSRPAGWVNERDLLELRQAAEEFSAAVLDAAALAERVKLLQEELSARIEEQTSRTLFVLTLVTVMALPVNLVAGLFGMNVGGIPFSQHPHGFLLVVGLLTVVTGILAYIALGKRRD
jgi:zinc transporter